MIRTEACFRFALLASTALSAVPAMAGDRLPTGGSVAHGSVDISTPAADAMAIRQSSDTAIVNWRGFSIGEGARVDIHQPGASSAMLNRVTGSTPSSIAGQLNANGQVYLVNPNGIAITPTGTVKTGAFVASTLATTDEDFIAGRRSFRGKGRSAAVVNQGSIEVGRGGYAALIGGKVDNSGTITANMGKIGLGAGEHATLDVSGDGFLQVGVPSDDDGDDTPLIRHSGRLSADGGRVEVKAATARQMARQVVNLSGVVEARSVGGRSGAIILGGGDGGRVRVSGRLDASAPRAEPAQAPASITPPPPRPSITISGAAIELAGATLDASAPDGGGTIRIGGDWQGGGSLPHAATTSADAATTIAADALDAGNGGSVVVWSDEHTIFGGRISARGGPAGGDGGSAEVSGKASLSYTGHTDLSAARGAFGTLLLDPFNVTISDAATTSGTLEETGVFIPSDNGSNFNAAELVDQLGSANIIITTGTAGDEAGDITVAVPLAWGSPTTLGLQAAGAILLNNAITAPEGALTLTAGGLITTSDLGAVNVATFTLASGTWIQVSPTLPGFSATDFRIPGGSFLRAVGGDGTPAAPYLIADAYGLQGIGSAAAIGPGLPDLADAYALANDIDASGTAGWNDDDGAQGFAPIGAVLAAPFIGSLDGQGFAIGGLFIDRQFETGVGLFAHVSGSVQNLDLTGVDVSGGQQTGGLAGLNEGVITQVSVSGAVVADSPDQGVPPILAGGLAGVNAGTISQSSSTATVTVNGLEGNDAYAGGLAGQSSGDIVDSVASGNVTANGVADEAGDGIAGAGGLVGQVAAGGTLARVSASGAVVANGAGGSDTYAGGLVGQSTGAITDSFALGDVTANGGAIVGGGGPTVAGGLVGQVLAGGTLTRVSASGDVAATGVPHRSVGGLVGNNAGSILQGYAEGDLPLLVPVNIDIGGLVGLNSGPIDQSYATGQVADGVDLFNGGLVGVGDSALVAGSFWDVDTTGQDDSAGGTGLTTADFQDTEAFMASAEAQGWSFTDTWAPPSTGFYPELYSISPVLRVDVDDATRIYGAADPEFTSSNIPDPLIYVFGPEDDSIDVQALLTTDAVTNSGIGTYTITTSADSATSAGDVTYRLVTIDGALEITEASLTIIADDQTKTYGVLFTFDGDEFTIDPTTPLVPGDSVTSVALSSPAALVGAAAGTYASSITATDAVGVGLDNYTIAFVPGDFTVERAPLTITADDQTKTYGQVFTFTGSEFGIDPTTPLFNADAVTSVALSSPAAAGTAAAGSYPGSIIITSATGTGLDNYTIAFVPGDFTVERAPLTITADDQTKTYGQVFTFTGSEFGIDPTTPLFNADAVTSVALSSPAAAGTAAAGSYPGSIIITSATGTGLDNYTIAFTPGDFTVERAPLTITADDQTKTYGQVFTFTGSEFGIDPTTPLFNADAVTSVAIGSPAAAGTAAAGSYPGSIVITSATGTGLDNYTIAFAPGDFTVGLASLTITADNQVKTYGNGFTFTGSEFTTDPSPLFNGDTVTSVLLSSPAAAATAKAGTYAASITASNAQGTGLENYLITYEKGDFTIDRRPLQIPIANRSKTYGETLATRFDYATGINGDTLRVLTASQGAGPAAPVAGNDYTINGTGVSGPDAGNYDVTFHSGLLTVTPRPLTVTADDLAKAFGRSFSFNGTEFTVGKGGLVNGDRVTAADLSSLGAAAGALPGSYTIDIDNADGPGLFVDGVANYDITYADGDLLVVQLPNLAPTFDAGLRLAYYNELPNPVDTLDFAIEGGGGGPTLGPTRAVATTAARERAQDTLTFLESLSDGLEERVSACAQVPPDADAFLACVGNALSEYADRIDSRILDLPEPLRQVSAVIRQSAGRIEGVRADAARRIASATTDAERAAIRREAAEQASAAMQAAITEINNAIDLIRAEDDPQLASLQSEQGATITAALQNVEDELIQAVGL